MTKEKLDQIKLETVNTICVDIKKQMVAGEIPFTVSCFADLHDYCDANTLGISEKLWDLGLTTKETAELLYEIQTTVDGYIKSVHFGMWKEQVQHEMNKKTINVKVEMQIELEKIDDLLCSGLEGGSNYWYRIRDDLTPKPDGIEFWNEAWKIGDGFIVDDYYGHNEDDTTQGKVNETSVRKALELMSKNHPKQWAEFMTEDYDCIAGDIFLQLCVFGEVIYG